MAEESVRRYFDSVAKDYAASGLDMTCGYPLILARARASLEWLREQIPPNGGSLVDVGCGSGQFLEMMASVGYRVHGIDLSERMISEAARRLAALSLPEGRATVEVADLRAWRPRRAVDGLTALGVLEYLPDDRMFLELATRSVCPGGVIIVSCRNRLFNLVSLNAYTAAEIDAGEYRSLLAEYETLVASDLCCPIVDTPDVVAKAFLQAMSEKSSDVADAQRDESVAAAYAALPRRQHSPLALAQVAREHGLILAHLRFLHCHVLPPRFGASAPLTFRALGAALEALGRTAAVASLASTFIAGFRREERS